MEQRVVRAPARRRVLGTFMVALAVGAPSMVAAQEGATVEHAVGIGLGYARVGTLDEAASRLVYGANTYKASLEYTGESTRLRWGLRTFVANGPENAIATGIRTIRFQSDAPDGTREDVTVPMAGTRLTGFGELRLAYVLRLTHVDVIAGGSLTFAISRPQGFVTPGTMQRLALEPSLSVRRRFGTRHTLELEGRTALIGWATRHPYHQTVSRPNATAYQGLVAQGSDVRSPATLRTLDLLATYRVRLRPRLATRVVLAFAYLYDEDPRPLTSLTTSGSLFLDVVF